MNPNDAPLLERIRALEAELEQELRERRVALQADFEERKVRFEQEVLAQQRRFREGLLNYLIHAKLRNVVSAPFIYAVSVALVLMDLSVTLYQWICFPLYRIPRVRRADYFVFDRHHLAYLNIVEKFNCAYCSYANGLAAYVREIVARTEQYWCPIKHSRRILQAHPHYPNFSDFGDGARYRDQLARLREELSRLDSSEASKPQ